MAVSRRSFLTGSAASIAAFPFAEIVRPEDVATAPELATVAAQLAEVIEGILGRDLTDKELQGGFDLDELIDKECSILVLQSKSKTGAVYSNVERVFCT